MTTATTKQGRVKLGTAVITCMGVEARIRKQYACEDGTFNYYVVPVTKYQRGRAWFPEWITRSSFTVI